MPAFEPTVLSLSTSGRWHGKDPGIISGFSFDSRKVAPEECFIALKSDSRDGHDFIHDAIARGASCAMTNRVLDVEIPLLVVDDTLLAMGEIAAGIRCKFTKPVVAITGSCGKTSTKEMLRLLLGNESAYATPGNWNNRIGVPMTFYRLDPEIHQYAIIEAGINQPGEMALLGEMIRSDVTIITNIGPAHIELLGSLEGIAAEKSKLAVAARTDTPLILPASVLRFPAFAGMAERCIAVRFAEKDEVPAARQLIDFQIKRQSDSKFYELSSGGQTYEVETCSLGNAQNAALAITAALELGVESSSIRERLRKWRPEPTRGRVVTSQNAYYYIDCYNANPASMADALQAFQESAPESLPRCYLVGAMNELGHSAVKYHVSIGEKLKLRPQDRALFVGPEALTAAYMTGALGSGAQGQQLESANNALEFQSTIDDFSGALFLKGSRTYQLEKLLPEAAAGN